MKILAITAFFPPYHSGGYEIRVKNILDELSLRGHEILVLTNNPKAKHHINTPTSNLRIVRKLHDRRTAKFFLKEILFDLEDTSLVEKAIEQFKPEVIYLGHTYVFSKAILPFISRLKTPVAYDEGGSGLIEAWTEHGRWFRFTSNYRSRFAFLNMIKPFVIKALCKFSHGRIQTSWAWPERIRIFFNSELNRHNALTNGVPIEGSEIIHSGIETTLFTYKPRTQFHFPLQIFAPGRIERRKGQVDAIKLVKILNDNGLEARLTLAGSNWVDGYYNEVLEEIRLNGLNDKINILPMLTTVELIKEYQKADICLFPSYFRTGFSRVPLEAMACGCILISYGNEGSIEVIQDRETGFVVKPGDLNHMFNIIEELGSARQSIKKVTVAARQEIEARFSMPDYIDQIERALIRTVVSS